MASGGQREDLDGKHDAGSSAPGGTLRVDEAPTVQLADSDTRTASGSAPSGPAAVRVAGPERPIVAGYHIVRLVGQGGMGVVWEAIDHRLGRSVALKVHAGAGEREVEALWLEARLAAKIVHPGIVPIHEAGVTASGEPYYTMDLVSGTSLRAVLQEGPMSPPRALLVLRSVAEAIGFAHARGVVHCDLKPGNIVVDAEGRARILDFGLAFAVSGEAGDAKEPARGSPPYMSPEQIAGEPLTAATDVYSLGVVLHEMLTGALPFTAKTTEEMLAKVALDAPEPPSKKNAAIGPELDRLCLACLAKRAEGRPADGNALAHEIGRLFGAPDEDAHEDRSARTARRSPPSASPPPLLAPHGSKTFRVEMRLASSPSRLWPLVSNTERLNRAVGLPHVAFTDLASAREGAQKTGKFRVLGMDVAWEEHPFEWVHERRHAVLRRYTKGPLAWLRNRVSLAPRAGGGTDLVHEVEAAPKGTLGHVAAMWEIQWKLARRLRAVYARMDAVARDPGPAEDPFEPPHRPTPAQIDRVSLGIVRLTRGKRRFAGELLDRLRDALLYAPDKGLERLRPFAIADAWGEARPDVLDLLLHAANAGLVEVAWDLSCPRCAVAHEVAASLKQVVEQGACSACGEVYSRDLARSVELIFRPHPEVRFGATGVYCVGSPAMRPHVLVQQALAPRERREITVTLPRGALLVRADRRSPTVELSSSPAGIAAACELRLGEAEIEASTAFLRAGEEVTLSLVNDTGEHQILRVERPPRTSDSLPAAAAMTHPTFQSFFSDELLAEGEHLKVGHLAFVAVSVEDRARVLQDLGDAAAFARFTELTRRVTAAAEREQGIVARAVFDGTLCAFSSSAAAVRAAIAINGRGAGEAWLPARVAVHAGRCIAVARGARVEYFGETIERTTALLADARAGVVAVSSAVDDEPAALAAMLAPGLSRTVGTTRAGEYGGRRVTWLARAD